MPQRIVLVGHCGTDAPKLEAAVSKCVPSAEVISVNSEHRLDEVCDEGADLLLINRSLPFGFETDEGVELMRELRQIHPTVKLMLISDRRDAQSQASEVGGIAGFGKTDIGSNKLAACLKGALKGKPN
jgi:DNA-binding NarL/FixJ family response regulator